MNKDALAMIPNEVPKSPFVTNQPVIPPIFVGRSDELSALKRYVIEQDKSVTISGYETVGKSSLVKTFLHQVMTPEETKKHGILPITISDGELYQCIETDFLSSITHILCAKIWKDVFGRSYSELLEQTILYPRNDEIEKRSWKLLKRIFQIVTSKKLSAGGSRSSEIGGKFILDGRSSEENHISLERKGLQQFEFMILIDEIMEVLMEHGYKRILFVCDQMNHLPPRVNYALISGYIDVFSSKKVSFMLSAEERRVAPGRDTDRVNMAVLLDSFSNRLSLKPFVGPDFVLDVVKASLGDTGIQFSDDAVNRIFEVTEGYPLFTVCLCDCAYRRTLETGKKEVSIDSVQHFAVPFSKAVASYKQNEGDFAQRWLRVALGQIEA